MNNTDGLWIMLIPPACLVIFSLLTPVYYCWIDPLMVKLRLKKKTCFQKMDEEALKETLKEQEEIESNIIKNRFEVLDL
jgi:hypothetical protein